MKNWTQLLWLFLIVTSAKDCNPEELKTPSHGVTTIPAAAGVTGTALMFTRLPSSVTAVAIGGGLGALSRYGVSKAFGVWFEGSPFYSTMTVNILGSFAFGVVSGWVGARGGIPPVWLQFLTTGFLGGFTTFSTFANDSVQIARKEGRLLSGLYVGASVLISVVGVLAGEVVGSVMASKF